MSGLIRTIIEAVRRAPDPAAPVQFSLFATPEENPPLRQAIEFYRHAHGWSNRFIAGDSLLRLEEPEKAMAYLKTALGSDPSLLAADASLGLALSRLGNHAAAVPHLEKALELDEDGSLYYQLGRAYQAMGQREKATAAMAKYQEILKQAEEQKEAVAREAQIGPPR